MSIGEPNSKWTAQEDAILRKAVIKYGSKNSWQQISACLPGRTNKSCRKRWLHSLDPNLRKGRWSASEDALLVAAVNDLGTRWWEVARRIPGRTDDQCAKRWRENLNPTIIQTPWTADEDRTLLDAHRVNGQRWNRIAALLPGRPAVHCRNRCKCLRARMMASKGVENETVRSSEVSTPANSVSMSPSSPPVEPGTGNLEISPVGPSENILPLQAPSPAYTDISSAATPSYTSDDSTILSSVAETTTLEAMTWPTPSPASSMMAPNPFSCLFSTSTCSPLIPFDFDFPQPRTLSVDYLLPPDFNFYPTNSIQDSSPSLSSRAELLMPATFPITDGEGDILPDPFSPHPNPWSNVPGQKELLQDVEISAMLAELTAPETNNAATIAPLFVPEAQVYPSPIAYPQEISASPASAFVMTCPQLHCSFQADSLVEVWKHMTVRHIIGEGDSM